MLSFIKNRPPLVVISLCILTAASTLTYFAFHISTTDLILDNDVIYNWNQLLKHFNDHQSCIEKETRNNKTETNNLKTVNTTISISPSDYHGFNFIQGNFILEGWHPVCDKNSMEPITFEIAFNIHQTNLSQAQVCASIKGHAEFLPNFIKPNCNASLFTTNKVTGNLLASKQKSKEFCTKGTLTKILFTPTEKDKIGNYLSSELKDTIYIHLVWSVYILFGVLLSILIFAFLESNQHKKYIEKFSQLIQR